MNKRWKEDLGQGTDKKRVTKSEGTERAEEVNKPRWERQLGVGAEPARIRNQTRTAASSSGAGITCGKWESSRGRPSRVREQVG